MSESTHTVNRARQVAAMVRVPEDEHRRIVELANQEERSVSWIIRRAIQRDLAGRSV